MLNSSLTSIENLRNNFANIKEEAIGLAKKWGITPEFETKRHRKDRVVVSSASTPQVWGSINGLRKVDSAFHPRYIGLLNEYQACLGS
ncbi:hypothetical protein TNCV_1813501 [Trichonephila clavipes]|uniref:Uncharacterized protein n=1 Tax=Trichonephila clavipes TaxID=2585209 RepID=A0A8X6W7N0_TRICX|nr:hypothetical protein TNCV_1813501 [Trichonephila clavipes]